MLEDLGYFRGFGGLGSFGSRAICEHPFGN